MNLGRLGILGGMEPATAPALAEAASRAEVARMTVEYCEAEAAPASVLGQARARSTELEAELAALLEGAPEASPEASRARAQARGDRQNQLAEALANEACQAEPVETLEFEVAH